MGYRRRVRLTVRNLGPLREATLDLDKDLIVLTGPNNTGKTWLAWTAYGLGTLRPGEAMLAAARPYAEKLLASKALRLEIADVEALKREIATAISSDLAAALPNLFGASLDRFEGTTTEVIAPSRSLQDRSHDRGTLFRVAEGTVAYISSHGEGLRLAARRRAETPAGEDELVEADDLRVLVDLTTVTRVIASVLAAGRARNVIFPAERVAVDLFSREIASARVRLSPGALLPASVDVAQSPTERRAPWYPAPISDALNAAVDRALWREGTSALADLADELQLSVLGGDLRFDDDGSPRFSPPGVESALPIQMASSVVKSLAGLVFYFRHRAQEGDVLVIDEPELNLHPDLQAAMARFVAGAVNRGVRFILSTHSDYFVRELNHCIMAANPAPAVRAKASALGYDEAVALDPSRVGVYLCRSGTAEPVEITPTGFQVETIDRAIDRLNAVTQELLLSVEDSEDDVEPHLSVP